MTEARSSSAFLSVVLLALVAVAPASLAPHDRHFLGNFAVYWLPLAIVLAALFFAGSGLPVAAGSAAVLTLFLVGYHARAHSLTSHEWVWGGYLFAMPGALAGGLLAAFHRKRQRLTLVAAALVAAGATAAGLALNVGVLCATLINCNG